MQITQQQKKAALIGAAGLGALVLARAWRRREAYDFAGKSVLVTGGSRGLGLVIARQLADEGANLTLLARDEEELGRAADDIRCSSSRPMYGGGMRLTARWHRPSSGTGASTS